MTQPGPDNRVAIALVLMVVACIAYTSLSDPKDEEQPFDRVMQFSADDSEMLAARQTAQDSIDSFIETFQNPSINQKLFSVKTGIPYGESADDIEYLWLHDLTIENGTLTGTVSNAPLRASSVNLGDTLSVLQKNIVDWSYLQDGKTAGSFTIRVMRSRLTTEQKAAFDREVQFLDP